MNTGWGVSQVPLFGNLSKYFCNILFHLSGCIQEHDIEYSLGDDNDIAEEQGLTQQGCAELAAATDGGLFWTYKSYQSRCYVKKTNGGRKYQLYAGLVSGNKECGVTGEDPFVTGHTFTCPPFRQQCSNHSVKPERLQSGNDQLHQTM